MSIHAPVSSLMMAMNRSSLWRFGVVLAVSLAVLGSFGVQALYRQLNPQITTKTSTVMVKVPYTSTTVESNTLDSGSTSVQTKGMDGEKMQVWTTVYRNGLEVSKKLSSEHATKAPTNEVILKGTRTVEVSRPAISSTTNGSPSASNSHVSDCTTKMLGAASIYTNSANSIQESNVESIRSMALQNVPRASISSFYMQAVGALANAWQAYASGLTMFTDSSYVACAPIMYAKEVFMPPESSLAP